MCGRLNLRDRQLPLPLWERGGVRGKGKSANHARPSRGRAPAHNRTDPTDRTDRTDRTPPPPLRGACVSVAPDRAPQTARTLSANKAAASGSDAAIPVTFRHPPSPCHSERSEAPLPLCHSERSEESLVLRAAPSWGFFAALRMTHLEAVAERPRRAKLYIPRRFTPPPSKGDIRVPLRSIALLTHVLFVLWVLLVLSFPSLAFPRHRVALESTALLEG
jgi:hypothetical protein